MKSGLKFLGYFFLGWASLSIFVAVASFFSGYYGCALGLCIPAGGVTIIFGLLAFFFDHLSKKYN